MQHQLSRINFSPPTAELQNFDGRPVKLELKVGVKEFDHVMEVDLVGGWNLRLKYTDRGLEIKQQVKPF